MAGDPHDAPASSATRVGTAVGVALALAAVVAVVHELPAVIAGSSLLSTWAWFPDLGPSLAFHLDGLSALFVLLIGGIGALVLLYSDRYLGAHPDAARGQLLLTLFMLSMLGLVLSDDVVLLFVFWELTTITSYLLIGFENERPGARRAALQALLVTGTGGLALLVGLLLMANIGGSFRISEWDSAAFTAHPFYSVILLLVLLGAFTKSAQVPFHFWLPNAMAAPTPVSAYLHSATMVKAGVYLLARLQPTLGGTDAWFYALTIAGGATALWGALQALRQVDLKLALAHTTVMGLGVLVLFLGSNSTLAATAAVTFLIVHALYKSALFLVVGIVDHASGTRDVTLLGGLGRYMPRTALAAGVAALSMAGLPPLLGFLGKELAYESALSLVEQPFLLVAVLVLSNALVVAVALLVAYRPFWGPLPGEPRPLHPAPFVMLLGPLLIAALGLVFGLLPSFTGRVLIEPAVSAIRGQPSTVSLALWHGFNAPLALSVVTIALGLGIYRAREPLTANLSRLALRLPWTGDRAYDATLLGLQALARWQTAVLQGGSLRRYLATSFATIAVAILGVLGVHRAFSWPAAGQLVPPAVWAVAALILAGTVVAMLAGSRLAAIAALGVVGVGVSLLFLIFGAPDVAMTQLMVETLFVVIASVALLRLPALRGADLRTPAGRGRDAVLSIAVGFAVAALLLAVLSLPLDPLLGDWFVQHSVPEGHGRNVVNVILVDFRALDTLGEITVVAVAAMAAYALLKLTPVAARAKADPR
jgi:multicomponent Na+:H+ antiporter subunit A